MTSKKHYKQVAESIRRKVEQVKHYEQPASGATWEVLHDVAIDLANIFEQDNPNFRRGAFLGACGMVGYPDN